MSTLKKILIDKKESCKSVWFMRQAGRYLPEFRDIRSKNQNFIKLCLNHELSAEITLQPLKRFELDAAIIFSDILMVPYGLNQEVEFKKNFGPILGELNLNEILNFNEKDFTEKLKPIYMAIDLVKKNVLTQNKSTIGFVGAPWTLLVYLINRKSPKQKLISNFFQDLHSIEKILSVLDKFLKIHIKNQIDSGAEVIQIFDSWAGLLEENISEYIYEPTLNLVNHTKKLGVPVICFPRGIDNYKNFCDVIKPDMVNIDYNVDPKKALKEIKIPIQGGLDPKVLLTDKENLHKEVIKYLQIFKDHPYVFNLGHGILPETKIEMVEELVKTVRDFK